jgi:hypothetical protein
MLQNEHEIRNGKICQYCGNKSELILTWKLLKSINVNEQSISLYCDNCYDVYVGCHKGGKESLGMLSDLFLRSAKIECHKKFDFIWQNYSYIEKVDKDIARKYCYLWLNDFFEFKADDNFNHIGKLFYKECVILLKFLSSEIGVETVYEFIERKLKKSLGKSFTIKDKQKIDYDFFYKNSC